MPHAALWVVQPQLFQTLFSFLMFQCRTRLCGWCSVIHAYKSTFGMMVSMPHAAIPFRPHHRFAVPLPRSRRGGLVTLRFLAESRNISFPRRCGGSGERSEPIGAPMPHAALWVVQHGSRSRILQSKIVSMPHAALWVVQPRSLIFLHRRMLVSMPHAALWVVQPACSPLLKVRAESFNAARGFVGGAAPHGGLVPFEVFQFQCRTRLCGWCSVFRS